MPHALITISLLMLLPPAFAEDLSEIARHRGEQVARRSDDLRKADAQIAEFEADLAREEQTNLDLQAKQTTLVAEGKILVAGNHDMALKDTAYGIDVKRQMAECPENTRDAALAERCRVWKAKLDDERKPLLIWKARKDKFLADKTQLSIHMAANAKAIAHFKLSIPNMQTQRDRILGDLWQINLDLRNCREAIKGSSDEHMHAVCGQMWDGNRVYPEFSPKLPQSPEAGVTEQRLLYPALLRPVSPNSPPARVLAQSQPKIKEVDEEIHRAQDALRHLIESNRQNEEERLEWTRESEEATIDAQKLCVSLVIDLVGARVDELVATSGKERADVLNHLLNRAGEDGQRNSIHTAYGMLVNRKNELERTQDVVRSAGKANDLRSKIMESSVNKETKLESFWDAISQFKSVEDFAGPSKDLLDAAYTIYRQAASLDNLVVIQANQEKTLEAAAVLRRYVVRLEAQEQAFTPH